MPSSLRSIFSLNALAPDRRLTGPLPAFFESQSRLPPTSYTDGVRRSGRLPATAIKDIVMERALQVRMRRLDIRHSELEKRTAVCVMLECLGYPPKEMWGGSTGTVNVCFENFNKKISKKTIWSVCERVHDEQLGGEVGAGRRAGSGGHNKKISPGSHAEKIMAQELNAGHSLRFTAMVVGQILGLPISHNTVVSALSRVEGAVYSRLLVVSQNCWNPASDWSKARLALAEQMVRQFACGDRYSTLAEWNTARVAKCAGHEAGGMYEHRPLWIDGMVHADEKHDRLVYGSMDSMSGTGHWRVPLDKKGNVRGVGRGGILPKRKSKMRVKYSDEIRLMYMIAYATMEESGLKKALKGDPFDYTKRTIVGMGMWDAAVKRENTRVMQLTTWKRVASEVPAVVDGEGKAEKRVYMVKGTWGGKTLTMRSDGNPYEALHGSRWEEEIAKVTALNKQCSVKLLIQHLCWESDKMFAGTTHEDDYAIHHDALSTMFALESREFMKTLRKENGEKPTVSYYDRLVKIHGSTDEKVKPLYRGRPTGNGPEVRKRRRGGGGGGGAEKREGRGWFRVIFFPPPSLLF